MVLHVLFNVARYEAVNGVFCNGTLAGSGGLVMVKLKLVEPPSGMLGEPNDVVIASPG